MAVSDTARNVLSFAREMKLIDDVSAQQLTQIFSHRVDAGLVQSLVIGREAQLARDLVTITCALTAEETLGYVLRFIADVVQFAPSLITALATPTPALPFPTDPVSHIGHLATTHRAKLGVFNPAIFLYGACIAGSPDLAARQTDISSFLSIVQSALTQVELIDPAIEYVIPSLCYFLRRPELRQVFAETGLVQHLPRLLSQCISNDSTTLLVQLTYEALWAIRLCTFDFTLMAMLYDLKIIPTVHRALQKATKEKIIRMALHILNNFLRAQASFHKFQRGETVAASISSLAKLNRGRGPQFYAELIGIGVLKTLGQLLRKKYGDDDIIAIIEDEMKVLEANLDDVTPFSEYLGEVQSGVLEWSPAHSSQKFWKENTKALEANEFLVLRDLGALLTTSTNELTLAVACHDIGEIVRHHPSGRLILTMPAMKGIKERVMQLMSHDNSEVAKHALTAVQKILIHKWDR